MKKTALEEKKTAPVIGKRRFC